MMDSVEYVLCWKQKFDWYEKEFKIIVWSVDNLVGCLIVMEEMRVLGFDSNGIYQFIEKLFG